MGYRLGNKLRPSGGGVIKLRSEWRLNSSYPEKWRRNIPGKRKNMERHGGRKMFIFQETKLNFLKCDE